MHCRQSQSSKRILKPNPNPKSLKPAPKSKLMSAIPLFLAVLLVLLAKNAAEIAERKNQFIEAPVFYNSIYCEEISHDEDYECSEGVVNIAMTLDRTYLRGTVAAIFSVFQHSSCPENLYFHFITSLKKTQQTNEDYDDINTTISNTFPYIRFRIYHFDEETVRGRISTSVREALERPLNYARSYLADLLPNCVGRVIYLDSDVILVDDIAKLYSTPIRPELAVAAPEYCNANFSGYFTPTFWSNPVLSLTFSGRKACYFNTGVMVVDLKKWRESDYRLEIEEWMDLQKRMRIYELGSLPPFLLVFAGKIEPVDHRWNQHGLGGDNYEGLCRNLHPGPVSLLHWSGRGKPWVRLDYKRPCHVDALWAPYDLLAKTTPLLES